MEPEVGSREDVRGSLESLVLHSTLSALKELSKACALPVSGRKQQVQERIMTFVDRALAEDNPERRRLLTMSFKRYLLSDLMSSAPTLPEPSHTRRRAYFPTLNNASASYQATTDHDFYGTSNYAPNISSPRMVVRHPVISGYPGAAALSLATNSGPATLPRNYLSFKPSPFYTRKKQLTLPVVWKPPYRLQTYHRGHLSFVVSAADQESIRSGKHRIYLCCQEYDPVNTSPQSLRFPPNFECRANSKAVEANTRGIKGVSDSVKPVDLTAYLSEKNQDTAYCRLDLQMFVSSDPAKDDGAASKSFAYGVYMVRKSSIEELVSVVEKRPHITKEAAIEQIQEHMRNEAQEMDWLSGDEGNSLADLSIVEAAYSLKDNVSCTRIAIPVRSTLCSHIGCFDCETYIQLQEQAETWKCPICSQKISFASLLVDDYFNEILHTVAANVESINIHNDGSWTIKTYEDDDSEDDSDYAHRPTKKHKDAQIEIIDLDSDSESEDNSAPPARLAEQPTAAAATAAAAAAAEQQTAVPPPSSIAESPQQSSPMLRPPAPPGVDSGGQHSQEVSARDTEPARLSPRSSTAQLGTSPGAVAAAEPALSALRPDSGTSFRVIPESNAVQPAPQIHQQRHLPTPEMPSSPSAGAQPTSASPPFMGEVLSDKLSASDPQMDQSALVRVEEPLSQPDSATAECPGYDSQNSSAINGSAAAPRLDDGPAVRERSILFEQLDNQTEEVTGCIHQSPPQLSKEAIASLRAFQVARNSRKARRSKPSSSHQWAPLVLGPVRPPATLFQTGSPASLIRQPHPLALSTPGDLQPSFSASSHTSPSAAQPPRKQQLRLLATQPTPRVQTMAAADDIIIDLTGDSD